MNEVDTAEKQGFDVKLMLWKGLKTLSLVVFSACVPVIFDTLSNSAVVAQALAGSHLPLAVTVGITGLIVAGAKMAANWWNHRDKDVQ